jgi:Protein of unknown function (DUF2971)
MTASASVPPNVQKAIDQFQIEAEKILQPFIDRLKAKKPPPIIYHYTGDVGLRGILETGQLWLTDVFSLNDPSELNHAFSLMLKALMSKAVSADAKNFAQGLVDFSKRVGIRQSGNYFVCSFSEAGDDLGQWRAYADNGRGYVLGFDTTELETAFTKEGQPSYAQTSPLTYNDAQIEDIHRQIVEKLFQLISLPCTSNAVQAEWYTFLAIKGLNAGLYFKHEAYRNEQEYRFLDAHPIDRPVPDVKIRYRPFSLIRYREFNWRQLAPDALKEIVIGPAADHQKAYQFASDCLNLFHSGTVKIGQSRIPYRAT